MLERTIISPPGGGGYRDFKIAGIFFYHRLSACKFFPPITMQTIFFKFSKFPITGVTSADNFFRCTSGADNSFQKKFSCRQFFLPIAVPPGEKIMVRPFTFGFTKYFLINICFLAIHICSFLIEIQTTVKSSFSNLFS